MKYIFKINEFRNQLEIPFDNKHPIYGKPSHVHIIDRLEEISDEIKIKPEDYHSNWNEYDIETAWKKNLDSAFDVFIDHELYDSSYQYEMACIFLDKYDIVDNQEYFNDEINNYIIETPDCNSNDIISKFNLYYDLPEYTNSDNEELKKINREIFREVFDNRLDENDVSYIIQENLKTNGLLPIYRAVSFNNDGDIYSELKKEYQGVGIYWSYDLRGAEPHGGWGKNNTFVLHGMINPEYINWVNTIFKSAWSLNEEKEIEVRENVPILIYKITEYRSNKQILNKELVIKT
jgi:hypothetical protein